MRKKTQSVLKLSLILTSLVVIGGFAKAPTTDTFRTFLDSSEPVIYSQQCKDEPMQVICDAINAGREEVFLRIYNLTAPEVISSLINQAKLGHKVSIHYQTLRDPQVFSNFDTVTLVEHPKEGRKLMHQKALAIDHESAWVGSANYTHDSFMLDSNLVIGIKSKELCDMIANQTSGKFIIHDQQAEYFSIVDQNSTALQALLQQIQAAKKTIRVAMFALSEASIIQELDAAQRRGVTVEIIVDKNFKSLCIERLKTLQSAIPVYAKTTPHKLHHKFGVFDQKTLVTGSVNWSENGFSLNTEDMIILKDLTPKQIKKMNRIWKGLKKQSAIVYRKKVSRPLFKQAA